MTRWLDVWMRRLILLGSSGWLFQAGCVRLLTGELEAAFAPEANPTLIGQSALVSWLGPAMLRLFATL